MKLTPKEKEKIRNRAKWLEKEAEVWWGIATNETDKWRARRVYQCAADMRNLLLHLK